MVGKPTGFEYDVVRELFLFIQDPNENLFIRANLDFPMHFASNKYFFIDAQ